MTLGLLRRFFFVEAKPGTGLAMNTVEIGKRMSELKLFEDLP
jgi:hypothetical protein